MPGRKSSSDEAASMDSLMDTLTNVVGILIILLAALQLNVATTIRRIQGIDPKATPEAVARLEQQSAELATREAELKDQWSRVSPESLDQQSSQLMNEIADLRKELEAGRPKLEDPDQLAKELEELKRKVMELEGSLATTEQQVADLRARLAETKLVKAPPAKIVRLPNPRNPPPNTRPVMFICRDDRVSVLDQAEAVKFAVETIKQRAIIAGTRCDCEKAIQLFDREKFGNEDFRFEIRAINEVPHLVIHHKEGQGTLSARVKRSNSDVRKAVAAMDPTQHYARFLVWPNAYEAYLAARQVCDDQGIAAGWLPNAEDAEWIISLGGELQCEGYVPPPPPKNPPPNPAPSKPVPADTVD